MAKPATLDLVSIADYLDLEEPAGEKHELFRGWVYAMAGGSSNHSALIVSLTQTCGLALRGKKPCRFVGEKPEGVDREQRSGYYPDGAVACPPNDLDRRRGTYDNPTVVFEVLSPSTAEFDRTDKFDDYRTLPSLQD